MNVGPSEVVALAGRPDRDQVMSSALLGLLVYTVGVKARGFNKKETYGATHVTSVGENSLNKMFKDEGARQDFIAHNRKHLTRAYPKGSRLNSSNFEPHHMWAAGVQLVALNWQTFGECLTRTVRHRCLKSSTKLSLLLIQSRHGHGAQLGNVLPRGSCRICPQA